MREIGRGRGGEMELVEPQHIVGYEDGGLYRISDIYTGHLEELIDEEVIVIIVICLAPVRQFLVPYTVRQYIFLELLECDIPAPGLFPPYLEGPVYIVAQVGRIHCLYIPFPCKRPDGIWPVHFLYRIHRHIRGLLLPEGGSQERVILEVIIQLLSFIVTVIGHILNKEHRSLVLEAVFRGTAVPVQDLLQLDTVGAGL